MGAVAVIATIAGAGLSAYGQYQAGQANKQIDDQNAALARGYAVDAVNRGAAAASAATAAGTRTIGKARTVVSGSGVAVDSNPVANIMEQTRSVAQLDSERIKNNALREALGYEAQASNFEYEGDLAAWRGDQGAASALLGGVGSAALTSYQTGLFPKFGK